MRYPASEKLEIIRLVEESHLSARLTLAKMGIPRTTFYRWYDRYLQRGEAGLQDQSPMPKHVWNRIPDEVRRKVVKLALKETELSPRELAVTFTDTESYFVSEASTYRILKAHDLITSPAFIVIKAASEFKDKTTAINQLLVSGMPACPAGQRDRPTSPIPKCLAGAGFISAQFWTITAAISSRGNSATTARQCMRSMHERGT